MPLPSAPHNNKKTSLPAGFFNFNPGSYLESTSRPLYALCFLLPWIIIYEFGTLWVNTELVGRTLTRKCVVAFIWLTHFAQWIGMHPRLVWLFPGFVVVVILIFWHLVSGHSWRVRPRWLGGMIVESVLFSLPLMALNAALSGSSLHAQALLNLNINGPDQSYWDHLVTGIGAGIYEELVFRFILMGLLLMMMEDLIKIKKNYATLIAVSISSLLFALHHYVGFENGRLITFIAEPFTLVGFVFRTAAGVYFAVIFRYRGYGVTARAHAAYDIILKTLWP